MTPPSPERAPRPNSRRDYEVRGFGRRPRDDDPPEEPARPLEATANILSGRSPLQTAQGHLRSLIAGGRLSPEDERMARNADASLAALAMELQSISAMVAHGMRLSNVVDCRACQLGFHKDCSKVNVAGNGPCYCKMNAHKPHKNALTA